MPRAYGTHLYLLAMGSDLVKVGRSMDVSRRLGEHKRSNPWGDLRLVAEFPDSGFMEPWVIRALCKHERRGEWVRCSVAEALAAIGEVFV
jgi:T5orf172 domain